MKNVAAFALFSILCLAGISASAAQITIDIQEGFGADGIHSNSDGTFTIEYPFAMYDGKAYAIYDLGTETMARLVCKAFGFSKESKDWQDLHKETGTFSKISEDSTDMVTLSFTYIKNTAGKNAALSLKIGGIVDFPSNRMAVSAIRCE
jgi:hypothetical protein